MSEFDSGAAPAAAESVPAPASEPAPSAPAAPEAAPSFEDSLRAKVSDIFAKNNPPRENGRFAPRNPTEAAPETAAPEATKTPDQPETAVVEQAKPAIDAPHSWSAEEKAAWAKVPPEAQSIIARRETEAHRQISQMGQQIKAHEPVRSVLEQHADYFQSIGRAPAEAMKQFIVASRHLDTDAPAAIRTLAQMYRVDLRALAEGQQQQPAAPAVDPQLQARLRRLEADATNRMRADEESRQQSVLDAIDKFAKDKSHPHFSDLEGEIVSLLPGLRAAQPHLTNEQLLTEAYEKAQWVNPTVRERILQDQRKADEEKRKAEQEKAVKEAKRQVPINQPPGKGATPVRGSLDDTLRKHVSRVMAR